MRGKNKAVGGINFLLFISMLVLIFMISVPLIVINAKLDDREEYIVEEANDNKEKSNGKRVSFIDIDGSEIVKVFITNENKVKDIQLEDYICSVVSGEMPANFEIEALKAQAIAARTYLVTKRIKPCDNAHGGDICDTAHCQVYMSKEKRMESWNVYDAESNWSKIEEAVNSTKGQVMMFNNQLVMYPLFFSTSSGVTENAIDVFSGDIPYLVSTESKGEEVAPKYSSETSFNVIEFIDIINNAYDNLNITKENIADNIKILSRSDAGGVKKIKIGIEEIEGTSFRGLLKLNSTNFQYQINDDEIIFRCIGYGHGVGMSQWGANLMAKEGKKHTEILEHYYKDVYVGSLRIK